MNKDCTTLGYKTTSYYSGLKLHYDSRGDQVIKWNFN